VLVEVRPPEANLEMNPGFGEVLVHQRGVVLALWIIGVDAAIFLFASLLARTASKQWARKAGPLESGQDPIEESKEAVGEMEDSWMDDALRSREEIGRLKERVTTTENRYAKAVRELEKAQQEGDQDSETAHKPA
jgi:hypothetical protein